VIGGSNQNLLLFIRENAISGARSMLPHNRIDRNDVLLMTII